MLINFENLKPGEERNPNQNEQEFLPNVESSNIETDLKLTLGVLIQNNPNKINFSLKEASEQLGVGVEFIRRRIKSKKIKVNFFGDKPMINIVELARILVKGVI